MADAVLLPDTGRDPKALLPIQLGMAGGILEGKFLTASVCFCPTRTGLGEAGGQLLEQSGLLLKCR